MNKKYNWSSDKREAKHYFDARNYFEADFPDSENNSAYDHDYDKKSVSLMSLQNLDSDSNYDVSLLNLI